MIGIAEMDDDDIEELYPTKDAEVEEEEED